MTLYLGSRAEWVRMNVRSSDRILDLGAGDLFCYTMTGLRPHTIVDKNYFWRDDQLFWRRGCDVLKVPKFYQRALCIDVCEGLPFDSESFDVVVATELFEHVDGAGKIMSEALRVAPKLVGTLPCGEHESNFPVRGVYDENAVHIMLGEYSHLVRRIENPYWEGFGFIAWRR